MSRGYKLRWFENPTQGGPLWERMMHTATIISVLTDSKTERGSAADRKIWVMSPAVPFIVQWVFIGSWHRLRRP